MARRKLGIYLVILLLAGLISTSWAEEGNLCLTCHQPHEGTAECSRCHGGNPRTDRQEIAHYQLIPARLAYFRNADHPVVQRGTVLLKQLGCRRCHLVGGEGQKLASDLDHLAPRVTPVVMEDAILKPALAMPLFPLTDGDRAALVNALLAARLKAPPVVEQQPRTVHFAPTDSTTPPVFVRQCGGCHQQLSALLGALGQGRTAPNLSGLLSPFYPRPLRENEPFNLDNLKRWLDNPRQFRPLALMPPRPLSAEDWQILQQEFAPPGD